MRGTHVCHAVHTQTCVDVRVLAPGVADEMALALELSRREGKAHHSPQRPQVQNRSPAEPDRYRSSPQSSATHRSFSAAPCYNYGVMTGSEEDEEDEDLQMALACSLSEMEAQERAAATDFISGAGGRGRAMSHKAGAHKKTRVVTIMNVNVAADGKIVAEEKDVKVQVKANPGPGGRWDKEGSGTMESGSTSESPTTSGGTPQSSKQESKQEFESALKSNDGRVKKKKKCRCTVC